MSEPLKSMLKLLPMMMRLAGDDEQVREQAVFAAWRAAAGPQMQMTCVPYELAQKHLVIAVPDATWKKQMEQVSGEFLFRINSLLSAPLVTYLEFRVDHAFVTNARAVEPPAIKFAHTQEIADELRPFANEIANERLREQFLRTAAKSIERKGD